MCATRTTSASGAASRAARNPPGRGASTLVICSARSAIRSRPSLRSRAMARRRARGEVAALGEDHERVVVVEAGRQRRDLRLEVLALRRVGRDEPGRDPVQQHVDRRVPRQRVLEDDARLAVVPVHERVDQRERVARPGVPAADQQRLAGVGVRCRALGRRCRAAAPASPRGTAPTSRPAPGRSGCPAVRRPHPAAATRREPVAEHHHEHAASSIVSVEDEDPEQPQRPPAAREQRRQRRRGDQPQRQQAPRAAGSPRGRPAR